MVEKFSNKSSIRQQMLSRRQALSSEQMTAWSEKIFKHFLEKKDEILSRQNYQTIGLYYPVKGEVDTRPFFQYFKKQNKICVFPKTQQKYLFFYEVKDFSEFKKGVYPVPEPESNGIPLTPDLVFVPGVAFDEYAYRLGFGSGCYDRTFEKQKNSFLFGLAYDFQVIPELPRENHDHPMDIVMTEKRIIFKRVSKRNS